MKNWTLAVTVSVCLIAVPFGASAQDAPLDKFSNFLNAFSNGVQTAKQTWEQQQPQNNNDQDANMDDSNNQSDQSNASDQSDPSNANQSDDSNANQSQDNGQGDQDSDSDSANEQGQDHHGYYHNHHPNDLRFDRMRRAEMERRRLRREANMEGQHMRQADMAGQHMRQADIDRHIVPVRYSAPHTDIAKNMAHFTHSAVAHGVRQRVASRVVRHHNH
jgi:hypothetical protein